jgi:hypothetical protein
MNKYKVAETIVGKILEDLKRRMEAGTKWDVADTEVNQEIADVWEDIVISELDKANTPGVAATR